MQCCRDRHFFEEVLLTDEAESTREVIGIFYNNHIWAEENSHGFSEGRFQKEINASVF